MHVEDSKGQLLFGTSDGQGPAVHTFETSPNTPKFQIQLHDTGVYIRDSGGRYLTALANDSIGFQGTQLTPEGNFGLVRHYDGTVSFVSQDNKYLVVDAKGDIRRAAMTKATPEAIFTIVELAKKFESTATKQPRLDCTPETIAEIRRRYGQVANNARLQTKMIDSNHDVGFGSEVQHRYRGKQIAEIKTTGWDESSTAERYEYLWDGGDLYFSYELMQDHREETMWALRKYYDREKPCRCLRRDGTFADKENFATSPDRQVSCAAPMMQ